MKKNQLLLSAAIEFAGICHKGQFDKSGAPYLLHSLKVMHYLKSKDEELNCIAVLHDTIEDFYIQKETDIEAVRRLCENGVVALRSVGMTERVIRGVSLLTKVPWKTEDEYYEEL